MEIYEEIVRLKKEGRASAVATIVQCVGSSPQKEGAKMLVRDDGSVFGTMGGGCLEAEVIQAAVMVIKDGYPRTLPIELTERHGGLVCGGKVLVYIEPVIPEPRLIILGAGHVGKALARVAKISGFRTIVVDDREEFANRENIPEADETVVHDFGNIFSRVFADSGSYIVIATRGHNHDLEALKAALTTDAGYIGLLGSKRKRALLFKMLGESGFSKENIGRVITPVGLSIGSVTPEEIAISIMAQIIQKRRGNIVSDIGSASCGRLGKQDGEAETTSSAR
ncbi:MAG TPA: XdhC/CoxI family protein [Candidatus Sulfobium mesophilum]|nr:XdhC/CoxI family protein [Candidatus Sulfobium mesophilum]